MDRDAVAREMRRQEVIRSRDIEAYDPSEPLTNAELRSADAVISAHVLSLRNRGFIVVKRSLLLWPAIVVFAVVSALWGVVCFWRSG